MVEGANRNAASTLAAVRNALGLSASAGPNSPSVITGIASQLNFRELVHTSYYTCAPLQALMIAHVRAHSTSRNGAGALSAWYEEGRRQLMQPEEAGAQREGCNRTRMLRLVEGVALCGVALLAWTASSALYQSAIYPLTDRESAEPSNPHGVRVRI
jgi:hypothetical protein